MLAPDHQAIAIVLALRFCHVGGDILSLVQGLPHSTAIILQQPAVDHHLDLSITHASSTSLGGVRQDSELRLVVPDEERGSHWVIVACHGLGLGEVPGSAIVALAIDHLPPVAVGVAAASRLDVGADAGDNLLSDSIVHRNFTHGVRDLHVLVLLPQTHALHHPGTDRLDHLIRQGAAGDLHEGQTRENRQGLGAVGPEDVCTTGLGALLVPHRALVPKPVLLCSGGDLVHLVLNLGEHASLELQGEIVVLQDLHFTGDILDRWHWQGHTGLLQAEASEAQGWKLQLCQQRQGSTTCGTAVIRH
mmetsp:Transcript_33660/g.53911  ORF Transcript_33660/g.53911 Transcript_33660/m.53911 type:complete len:304 (-) Transcript_33660:1580-2491(-)